MISKEHRKYWMIVGAELDLQTIETKIQGLKHLLTSEVQNAYEILGDEKKLIEEQYAAMLAYARALKARIQFLKQSKHSITQLST